MYIYICNSKNNTFEQSCIIIQHTQLIWEQFMLQETESGISIGIESFTSKVVGIHHVVHADGIVYPILTVSPPIQYGTNSFTNIPVRDFTTADANGIFIGTNIQIDFILDSVVNQYIPPSIYFYNLDLLDTDSQIANMEAGVSCESLRIDKCPSCNYLLYHDDTGMFCVNDLCPAQLRFRCLHFNNAVGIRLHGIYTNMLNQLILRAKLSNPIDIFNIPNIDDLYKFIGEQYTTKQFITFKNIISSVMGKVTIEQLFKGMRVPRITDNTMDVFVVYHRDICNQKGIPCDLVYFKQLVADFIIEAIKTYEIDLPKNMNIENLSFDDIVFSSEHIFHQLVKHIDTSELKLPGFKFPTETSAFLYFMLDTNTSKDLEFIHTSNILGSVFVCN